jgi:anti-anti-sigma factor
MTDYRYFIVDEANSAVIVRLTEPKLYGDVLAEMLKSELSSLVKSLRPKCLLVDFDGVNMISSSVIGVLLLVKKQLEKYGAKITLCGMPIPIREVYRVLGLDGNIFDIRSSIEEALTWS